ncbi:MAG: alanine--glyoxylate aminotransferase family protein [Chloroflexota bacterium]|nr:alanine--glyoxylate aminotransferase family protein [Chloroflexota bacterium]
MGSGPSNPEPRVLQALATAPIAPDDPAFGALLDDVSGLGRAVFQTRNACTLAVAGASRAGIEAVLASAIQPGDSVLVGVYGHFGELLCTLAARHGASVERVNAEWGSRVGVQDIVDRVRERPPKLVAIVHADTSTGILQPLEAIGRACRDAGALFVVDAVLSLGGCQVAVDAWRVDAAIGGLQKCLGGPPGLALVTYSDRFREARGQPHTTYLDLARLEATWVGRQGLEAAAMPTSMLLAAREALRMVVDEGLVARWERHRRASRAMRAGLEAMGLELFGDPAHSVPMISLVRVPDGMDEAGVREQLLREHGIEIMAAFGPLRGRVWRLGSMGTNARLTSVVATLSGLEAVLVARGFRLSRGAAVDAALTVF